ncbi:MAG: MaoC family dehydratase N-terminal domain-containing protein [Gammaproteobacteria bacterium]|nr:MaoC family dehydratase N-terminal domain-containing protein [Gammaproteobacteria bacterium]MBL4891171.1 MaoC family dehydratase N-terminal domain-containing protein [Rhizobiaceae bacterium]
MQNASEQQFQEWIGKVQSASSTLTTAPMEGLAATLDRSNTAFSLGDALPPLWHWLYFLQTSKQSEIAKDGHPHRGDFLPPIPLPRRMWAGSRLNFIRPLIVGESIQRTSTIKSIALKQGRSGKLGFVCVAHELSDRLGVALIEEHDIVYRDLPSGNVSAKPSLKADEDFDFTRTVTPDPVLLFRYSALTFNGHRIHYDRAYAKDTESYPGLVVHGPLLATYLLELLNDNYPNAALANFSFKAIKPVFDIESFQVCGTKPDDTGNAKLWIADNAGNLCMEAWAVLAETQ